MVTFTDPAEAAEAYSRWVARTGLSERTAESYTQQVARFAEWLIQHGEAYHEALWDEHVRDYAVRDYRRELLTTRQLAPRTVALTVSALGSFYDWMGLGRPANVGVDVPESVRRGITVEEKRAVLRAAERRGPRDFALLSTLMLAGPRVRELSGVNVGDVAITDRTGQMQVRYGKGGKPRTIPLSPQVRGAVRAWLAERASWTGSDGPALWLSRGGNRMPPRTIQHTVSEVGIAAKLDRPLTPHVLRHTFARQYLEQGGDVASLQRLMGHASLQTTAGYLRATPEFVEEHLAKMDVDL